MFNNITYSHEHIVIDLSKGKNNKDCYLNLYEEAMDELLELKNAGVSRLVDCSNHGIGVDWKTNKKIEEMTGLKIINSTGYYKDPFFPEEVCEKTIEELSQIMLCDLANGAKVIGEIGTSENKMTENERKVFEAACRVQLKTNCVILTHTTLGTYAKQQVQFFKERKINLKKVIISHVALAKDFEMIVQLVEQGVNVAFDTIGKEKYCTDESQATSIAKLIELGFQSQLLLSMDCTRQSHLKKNGGHGFLYLLDTFVPLLKEKGVAEEVIERIMCHNFSEIMEA